MPQQFGTARKSYDSDSRHSFYHWLAFQSFCPPFFQGKTIAVGPKAGDIYDSYPRLLAEFWTIPGNRNIIVRNVPGAASLIAVNQVYSVAKPDGLTNEKTTGK